MIIFNVCFFPYLLTPLLSQVHPSNNKLIWYGLNTIDPSVLVRNYVYVPCMHNYIADHYSGNKIVRN